MLFELEFQCLSIFLRLNKQTNQKSIIKLGSRMTIHFNLLVSLLTFTKRPHQLFTSSVRKYGTTFKRKLETHDKWNNESSRSPYTLTSIPRKQVSLPLVTICPGWQSRCGNLKKKKDTGKFRKIKRKIRESVNSHFIITLMKLKLVRGFLNLSSK